MGRLNKPAIPGYEYRSPKRTNARDLTPNLREDTGASQRADLERIGRGLNADAATEHNRRMQQEAGGRAVSRTLGRAGLLGAAATGGYELGKEIDKRNPKIGEAIDKAIDAVAVRGERAKLTPDAARRIREMEGNDDQGADTSSPVRAEAYDQAIRHAKGGKVTSASRRADGIAKRGKTRGKYV